MRFNNFFIAYKIALKELKHPIEFDKLPLCLQICSILILIELAFVLISIIEAFLIPPHTVICPFEWTVSILVLTVLITLVISSRKSNLKYLLDTFQLPYSKKRMDALLNLLREHRIDYKDNDILDLLIEEAERAQSQCDFLAPFKQPLKTLSTITGPIIMIFVPKILDIIPQENIFYIIPLGILLILLCLPLILFIPHLVKELFYWEYKQYEELIYDLRQIKIFY